MNEQELSDPGSKAERDDEQALPGRGNHSGPVRGDEEGHGNRSGQRRVENLAHRRFAGRELACQDLVGGGMTFDTVPVTIVPGAVGAMMLPPNYAKEQETNGTKGKQP